MADLDPATRSRLIETGARALCNGPEPYPERMLAAARLRAAAVIDALGIETLTPRFEARNVETGEPIACPALFSFRATEEP